MVSINNNMGGMRAHDALQQSHRTLQTSLERLSTGIRINRAEDDAAGIMVRDRFQAQINGFEEGIRNIQTAQGMIQVAEQGLNKITDALQQMRALAVRAADDNLNDGDRGRIQNQIKGLLREVNERAQRTSYNGHNLLDGSIADSRAARDGFSEIQTNSFLANGNTMVSGVETVGNSATTTGGISQGSYEVKLVFDANKRDNPVATTATTLSGSADSGFAYLNSTTSPLTVTQTIQDKSGNNHDVNITFTNTGANTYEYTVTSGAGGDWVNPINVTGDVTFNNNGDFQTVTTTGGSSTSSTAGSKLSINIPDGTGDGQTWKIDFGKLKENDQSPAVSTPNVGVTNGTVGTQTNSDAISGIVNGNAVVGSVSAAGTTYIDRTGDTHGVTYTMQKTIEQTGASNLADTWKLTVDSLSGGAWSGANSNTTVDVEFDSAGYVSKINGQSGNTFTINIGDGTSAGQEVTIDLSGLNSAAGTALATNPNGTAGVPSTNMALNGNSRLSSDYGPITFNINNLVDRTGMDSVPGAKLTFTQVGTSNTWNYAVEGPTTSGFTGAVTGGTGSVNFSEDGDLLGPNSFTFKMEDGTAEGQQITMSLVGLKMGRAENFSNTTSNGSQGTGDITVNAEIYFSGASDTEQPVMTLEGISQGAKSANLGGISFTVAQATSLDVGLTTFVKAHTYVSATVKDNALQFQVGPDEGMIHRMGIQKMDVQTIFRGGVDSYDYKDIKLDTQLQAQDLIGQLDDAINFVGEENLKVGTFQNVMTRTLDLARQQQTSITGAQSNLNDADMASEATNQSKRSILVQSGTAMVAQANTTSQFILQLLR